MPILEKGKRNDTKNSFLSFLIRVKSQLEEKVDRKFPMFKAVEFRSQVVAGMNYLIKVAMSSAQSLGT
ncbi:hypothetical protein FD754_025638 [Muntiacus muntjak]|uniref:Cystatin domain-containing protein n=1 Tax=Muntiacus muntjak TaxID=9888 RepID=A0A5N3UI00_MUNMU|nr:hypothetical protein FD754_025638 [Muntiacus muntjak]